MVEVQKKGVKEVQSRKGGYFELDIVNLLNSGKRPIEISKILNISKSLLSYYMARLKSNNQIRKIGYGVWETSSKSTQVATIRGHAFLWKLAIKSLNWEKRLNELHIPFKKIARNTYSIMFRDRKVWLGKNIIIYEPESFMGQNAVESRKYAINRLIEHLEALEHKFDIDLKPYRFKVSRQHYSIIKNSLAIQCNKVGQKIQVSNDKGMWFIIDNSYNLNEAETIHPETALIDNLGIQKYFNEHKDTHFQVTPKFILESFNKLNGILAVSQQQLLEYRKENKSHLALIKQYRKENMAWRKNEVFKIKKELNEQTSLGEWL